MATGLGEGEAAWRGVGYLIQETPLLWQLQCMYCPYNPDGLRDSRLPLDMLCVQKDVHSLGGMSEKEDRCVLL